MRDYTKIEAWKLADDLTVAVYERTRAFPREEIYGLTAQLRRASYSVPANIVEGASRESKRDYLHFLYIARGSLSETQYFSPPCAATRLFIIERRRRSSAANEDNVCVFAWIDPSGREIGWKIAQNDCDYHERDRD